MPVYLYECTKCERKLEVTQNIKDKVLKHKRHIKRDYREKRCNGTLKRLIAGSVSVAWKGGAPTSKTYV
jgi:predicted nucleic acid-binding Zn ribbon protein